MGMPVRIDDDLYNQARAQAQAEWRTLVTPFVPEGTCD